MGNKSQEEKEEAYEKAVNEALKTYEKATAEAWKAAAEAWKAGIEAWEACQKALAQAQKAYEKAEALEVATLAEEARREAIFEDGKQAGRREVVEKIDDMVIGTTAPFERRMTEGCLVLDINPVQWQEIKLKLDIEQEGEK